MRCNVAILTRIGVGCRIFAQTPGKNLTRDFQPVIVALDEINLGAVARGQQRCLTHRMARAKLVQKRRTLSRRHKELLANLDGRSAVIHASYDEPHYRDSPAISANFSAIASRTRIASRGARPAATPIVRLS